MWRKLSLIIGLVLIPSLCFGGIDFDGVDDCVTIVDNNSLDATTQITISAWIDRGNDTSRQQIIAKDSDTNGRSFILDLYDLAGDDIVFAITDGTLFYKAKSSSEPLVGVKTHICGTYDALKVRLYVGGSLLATSGDVINKIINNSASSLQIGSREYSTARDCFTGEITEVAIWNVALTPTEISLLASSCIKGIPLQIRLTNLVGYWSMDDQETGTSADGDMVRDLSGNGNNGTGDDGANNTGLLWIGESVLSYPSKIIGN